MNRGRRKTPAEKSLTEREKRQPPVSPNSNSKRFHEHPSHPSSCLVYEEFYNRKCPCDYYEG